MASHLNRLGSVKTDNMDDKDRTNTAQEGGQNVVDINTDENIAGTSHLQEEVGEQTDAETLRIELQEQKDKFIRLYAEFDNFKRRNARERVELIQTAGKDVIVSLLEVLDDCDRAEKQLNQGDDLEQIRAGIRLVFNKLRNTLQARGLKEMSSVGQAFNPDLHEAITEIPVPDPAMDGKVVDEVEKGYTLNDKIIRFSKVVVGKQMA
jgi:molecular chaperone GrpE